MAPITIMWICSSVLLWNFNTFSTCQKSLPTTVPLNLVLWPLRTEYRVVFIWNMTIDFKSPLLCADRMWITDIWGCHLCVCHDVGKVLSHNSVMLPSRSNILSLTFVLRFPANVLTWVLDTFLQHLSDTDILTTSLDRHTRVKAHMCDLDHHHAFRWNMSWPAAPNGDETRFNLAPVAGKYESLCSKVTPQKPVGDITDTKYPLCSYVLSVGIYGFSLWCCLKKKPT